MKEVYTVPDLLPLTRGNMTKLGELLGCSRDSIRKYSRDKEGLQHCVVNGVLMSRKQDVKVIDVQRIRDEQTLNALNEQLQKKEDEVVLIQEQIREIKNRLQTKNKR